MTDKQPVTDKLIMDRLVYMSQVISKKGLIEEASLQEAGALLVAAAVNGEAKCVDVGSEEGLESAPRNAQTSAEVIARMNKTSGIVWAKTSNQKLALAMYWVDSQMAFDSLPIFLQNYVAETTMPQLICVCIEEVSRHQNVKDAQDTYYALPYMLLLQCHEEKPSFTLGFAGHDRRQQVVKNQQAVWDEAMSSIRPFFLMMGLAIKQLN